ncbi:MAG: hypothetical protein KDC49_09735 [Saprospiraceae bacterium]|nr:hypothetical protein [Saprospiraceae bacterium]
MSYTIYHQLVIHQSVNTVFDGFTMPNHLEQWWPLKCTGEPQMGALYNFNFADQ